jgi:isopentenyl diphosphate isomerase/L-lactate dehydrogenase-like FMN-dependent dehydrogenase
MREDMVRTLRLLGANSVEELDASFVRLALGEGPIPP